VADRIVIRYAGHLGSSVLEQAKASHLPPPYGYSSLWESLVNPSTQPTIIYFKTVRTTWPRRQEMRTGSAYALDSSLYPVQSIVTRLIIHTSAGFVHVTTPRVRTLKRTRQWGTVLSFPFQVTIHFSVKRRFFPLGFFPDWEDSTFF